MEPRVRNALPTDVRAINAIYNHYVRTSTCTWHLTEESDEGRLAWLRARTPAHPALVVEIEGKVVGWGARPAGLAEGPHPRPPRLSRRNRR